ncbi:MAG TPA: hypothetical protein VNL71_07410 [Chloroflexota bacterium]|nr:hypothetical protein [Chloroflexota bacterium]
MEESGKRQRRARGSKAVFAALATTLLTVALASLAYANLIQRGDLFVTFNGGISPSALPRHQDAPISVALSGTVKTLSGSPPPSLRQITIEINRAGHLDTTGLPLCHVDQLEATSDATALSACRRALVGSGGFSAEVAFPEQPIIASHGTILAFNGREGSRPVILAHIFGTEPLSITRIMVFHLRHTAGGFGTVFSGTLPPEILHYGYVTAIDLHLHRIFTYRGTTHSYLSAACPAPAGFSSALFPFARGSMTFEDGRTLTSTLTRSCKVRG